VRRTDDPPSRMPEHPHVTARKHVHAWRSYNQRRWELEKDIVPADERAPFVCECTDDGCLHAVELTMLELEAAHMCPSWTAVLPGHVVDGDGSRVLVRHPHFWIVELLPLPDDGPRDAFVRAARSSDRSQTSGPPEPSLPQTGPAGDADLEGIVEAARRRSPSTETGQAG
jgi:hypothetical protein